MKYGLLIACLFCMMAGKTQAQFAKGTRIYLVRHAEKDTGKNPVLTLAGRQRAGDLLKELRDKKIHRIYTTPYRRTIMTGDSLRIQLGIDTAQYAADTLSESLIKEIIAHSDEGKTILVIGHSNTVPALIRKLGIKDFVPKELPETEFDNLFLVTYKKGKARVKASKYGKASGASAKMSMP